MNHIKNVLYYYIIILFDFNEVEIPPMNTMFSFLSFMVSIKEQLENGLLYTTSLIYKSWVENILNFYKPIYIVSEKNIY